MEEVDLVISLPADVAAALGESEEVATCAARRAVILHLVRAGALSQGRAASLLHVTRHDILDMMATYDIPSGPQSIEDYRRDIEQAARLLSNHTL
jgi:hypothetical protein